MKEVRCYLFRASLQGPRGSQRGSGGFQVAQEGVPGGLRDVSGYYQEDSRAPQGVSGTFQRESQSFMKSRVSGISGEYPEVFKKDSGDPWASSNY